MDKINLHEIIKNNSRKSNSFLEKRQRVNNPENGRKFKRPNRALFQAYKIEIKRDCFVVWFQERVRGHYIQIGKVFQK